jgi:moderate conductance mechanosensitive channel
MNFAGHRLLVRAGIVAAFVLVLTPWGQVRAAPAAPAAQEPGVSRAQVAALLAVLNDPAQRAKLVDTLRALERALPVAEAPAAPPAAPAKPVIPLAPNSVLLQLLHQILSWSTGFAREIASLARVVDGLPLLWNWIRAIAADPATPELVVSVGSQLAGVLALAALLQWTTARLLRPARARLVRPRDGNADAPDALPQPQVNRLWHPVRVLPLALLRLILDLLPLAGFAVVGNLLPGLLLPPENSARPVILALVNAYVAFGVTMAVTRMLTLPDAPSLRLLQVSDAAARYITRWMQWLAGIAIFGLTVAGLGTLWGLDDSITLALQKIILLADHVFLVVIVLQRRREIAARIQPRPGATGVVANALRALAGVWHYIAIFFIVGLWLVWAADVRNGYVRLWQIAVVTAAVLVAARLLAAALLAGLDHLIGMSPQITGGYSGFGTRVERYHHVLRAGISGVIALGAGLVLLQSWGLDAVGWLTGTPTGRQVMSTILSIGITILIAVAAWEAANMAIERQLERLTRQGQLGRAARLRTILPILRTGLLVTVLIVAGLTVLAQIGVNIAPLLAGAGIIGIAIGFGSQKLVQDLITGIFLLLESAMQVGDFVTLAGVSGTVEHLSVRTIRLRAADGSVHLIPFSSVTTVNNTNRGLGNAAVNVNVSASEDTDQVGEVLKQIALEMREDAEFKDKMLSDLQLWGVDKVEGAVVTLAGQIVCTDSGRWGVQREFNRRYKIRFQELGFELANPTRTLCLRHAPPTAKHDNTAEGQEAGSASATLRESPPASALGHSE